MDWDGTRVRAVAGTVVAVGLIAISAGVARGSGDAAGQSSSAEPRAQVRHPAPPRLPRNFQAEGVWIVRDLGIKVPFRWWAKDGDMRMVAGGRRHPIWFTNIIYRNAVYTLTYRWPGLNSHPCDRIPGYFSLHMLNQLLRSSRFVGREILVGNGNPRRHVNHWRAGVVWPPGLPPGNHLRIGLALGDFYVDQGDRSRMWQLLQFGVQNLFDPELDEWARLDTWDDSPAEVTLPERCPPPQ